MDVDRVAEKDEFPLRHLSETRKIYQCMASVEMAWIC